MLGLIPGVVLAVRLVYTILHYALGNFSYTKYKGEWAVITGASAGIGAGMARRLSKRGINVALLARSIDKLKVVADECSKNGVDTKIIPFDFAEALVSDWNELESTLKALGPTILINNVGVNVSFPTDFVDVDENILSQMLTVNIQSTNRMTRLLLPYMIERNHGIVLCLSSGGGAVTPAPLLAPYAGTKAYNDAFAVSLAGEVPSDVHIHSLTPFFVESAMAKMRKSFSVPSADAFAEAALRLVSSSPRLQPYWVHMVMELAITALPLGLQVKYVADLHRKIRVRALRKKERQEKQNWLYCPQFLSHHGVCGDSKLIPRVRFAPYRYYSFNVSISARRSALQNRRVRRCHVHSHSNRVLQQTDERSFREKEECFMAWRTLTW